MSDTTSAAAAATTAASAATATATESTPAQKIVGDIKFPALIVAMVVYSISVISLIVFLIIYNCCYRAEERRRYVEHHAPSSPRWVPDVHVPNRYRKERAAEATVYRFA